MWSPTAIIATPWRQTWRMDLFVYYPETNTVQAGEEQVLLESCPERVRDFIEHFRGGFAPLKVNRAVFRDSLGRAVAPAHQSDLAKCADRPGFSRQASWLLFLASWLAVGPLSPLPRISRRVPRKISARLSISLAPRSATVPA